MISWIWTLPGRPSKIGRLKINSKKVTVFLDCVFLHSHDPRKIPMVSEQCIFHAKRNGGAVGFGHFETTKFAAEGLTKNEERDRFSEPALRLRVFVHYPTLVWVWRPRLCRRYK